jgi:hypothetical protein
MQNHYARLRFLAGNYSRLQGLREVPIGALVIFVALWSMDNRGASADLTAPVLATLACALLYWLTGCYYARTLGQVTQTKRQRGRETSASVVFSLLAILALWLDTALEIPFSVLGLVFAGALLENFWRATETVRKESLTLFPENFTAAILILAVSLLPLFGFPWWQVFGIRTQVQGVFLVIGLVIILAGFWGHLRIHRALRPAGDQ